MAKVRKSLSSEAFSLLIFGTYLSFGLASTFGEEKIIFSGTKRPFEDKIYSISPDGTNLKQLTQGKRDYNPLVSPSGSKIGFVSNRRGTKSICVMDIKSGAIWDLLIDKKVKDKLIPEVDSSPEPSFSWLSDSVIIFKRQDCGGLYKCLVNSRKTIKIREHKYEEFAGSPDGTKIAFSTLISLDSLDYSLEILNPDGRVEYEVTCLKNRDACDLIWSPDSKSILFRDLNIMPNDLDPQNHIYHVSALPSSTPTIIYTLNSSDSLKGSETVTGSPSWSPDGGRVAFSTGFWRTISMDSSQWTSGALYIYEFKDKKKSKILDTWVISITWAPNGKGIAVLIQDQGRLKIARLNVSGEGGVHVLTPPSMNCYQPQWINIR